MNLSRRIAEVKGINFVDYGDGKLWIDFAGVGQQIYSPETNKAQAMDLLIDIVESDNPIVNICNVLSVYFGNKKEGLLIAICKAWLSAFGGE